MKEKIAAVIQARMGSTRLPNKVLLDLKGETVLERVLQRVAKSKLIDEVLVATTILKDDLRIVNLCSAKGIRVYCGFEDDVLDRYYQACRLLGAQHIVRITADCPLIDPEVIDNVIRLHLKEKSEYTSNTIRVTFPDGEDVEVFTEKALKRAWKEARLSSEREHVTLYMRNHPDIFKLSSLVYKEDLSLKRWTLDEPNDYRFIKEIYKRLHKKSRIFGMQDILRLLKLHPEYEKINQNIMRNQGYMKSLKKDKVVKPDYIYGGGRG